MTGLANGDLVIAAVDTGPNDGDVRLFTFQTHSPLNPELSLRSAGFSSSAPGVQENPFISVGDSSVVAGYVDKAATDGDLKVRLDDDPITYSAAGDPDQIEGVGGSVDHSLPVVVYRDSGSNTVLIKTNPGSGGLPVGNGSHPHIARLADGSVVVTWQDDATGDVMARIFEAGPFVVARTDAIPVSPAASLGSSQPHVCALQDGRFLVVWTHDNSGGGFFGKIIYGRIYNSDGESDHEPFLIDSYDDAVPVSTGAPRATQLVDGRIVVTYQDGPTADTDIKAKILDPRLSGVEVAGTPFADDHIGSRFADVFVDGAGNDRIAPAGGNDQVFGGNGTDTVVLRGLLEDGFALARRGGTIHALDLRDHSRDTISSVENFSDGAQTIGLAAIPEFNALAYAASYNDLAPAFRTNADAAFAHFLNHGFFERRDVTFDAAQYLENWADVNSGVGGNQALATQHFLNHGVGEKRLAEDPLDYIASYSDLILAFDGNSQASLEASGKSHYATSGFAQGRRGGIDFDPQQYLQNSSDLSAAFTGPNRDDAAAVHFINYGYAEHRLWEDPLLYVASYADLTNAWKGLSETAIRSNALAHFGNHGFNEGRRAGIDFDVEAYLANYSDLRTAFADGAGGYNEHAALLHYIQHGFMEGRTDVLLA